MEARFAQKNQTKDKPAAQKNLQPDFEKSKIPEANAEEQQDEDLKNELMEIGENIDTDPDDTGAEGDDEPVSESILDQTEDDNAQIPKIQSDNEIIKDLEEKLTLVKNNLKMEMSRGK